MANNLPGESSILYLDQNVVRYVTNLKKSNPGIHLGKIIDKGVEIGALICPFSDEHFWETSAISDEGKRRTQLAWLANASHGACFLSREDLVAAQLIALVRPKVFEASDFLCEVDIVQNESQMREMQVIQELRKKEAEAYFADYNLRRARGRNLRNIPNEVNRVREIDLFFMGIADCIECYLTGSRIADDKPFGAQVLRILVDEHRVQHVELELMLNRIISTKGHCVPLIKIQSRLYESWMLEQKHLAHNDIVDLYRISTVLPYADIIVVDREQCRHLESAGLSSEFGATVFSLTPSSLESLCEEIYRRIGCRLSFLSKLKH